MNGLRCGPLDRGGTRERKQHEFTRRDAQRVGVVVQPSDHVPPVPDAEYLTSNVTRYIPADGSENETTYAHTPFAAVWL